MATRDWDEPEGDEFNTEMSGEAMELSLGRLFGESAGFPPDRSPSDESSAPRQLFEKEVRIVGVYEQVSQDGQKAYFVMVRDNRDRNLRIYIGAPEAQSIAFAVEGRPVGRPMTHDLTKIIVERLGWSTERVTVDDEYNGIYYAKLTLFHAESGESIDIDCRPSDAIALAVRSRAPLYVAEAVLESEGRKEQEL